MTPCDNPDYHALIRGVRAIDRAGGDSTVARLVVADWLDEHGCWRWANYVRLSCELDAMNLPDGPCSHKYECPCGGLADAVKAAHAAIFDDTDQYSAGVFTMWHRGFRDRIECPFADWLTHGPDLCRRHPVRNVTITDWDDGGMGDGRANVWASAVRVCRENPAIFSETAFRLVAPFWHLPTPTTAEANAAALRWAEQEADMATL